MKERKLNIQEKEPLQKKANSSNKDSLINNIGKIKKSSQNSDMSLKKGQRIEATLVFADMKDFTKITENLDPEDVDKIMNEVFYHFEKIINSYEGWVEKYIGDALVAVFGAKIVHEDDPSRAINASLDFLETLSFINNEIKSKYNISLKDISFRIGIHTGIVTKGKRGDFDVVTGHALAIASRLQSVAAVNTILISDIVYEKVKEHFIFSAPINISVKGKSSQLIGYVVLGRNQNILSYSTSFVGRRAILDNILRKYLKHDDRTGFCFYIWGEAGIGKTRLMMQFIEEIRKFPNYNSPLLYTRASPYGNSDFSIIIKLILFYLNLSNIPNISENEILKSLFENGINFENEKKHILTELLRAKNYKKYDEKRIFDILLEVWQNIIKRFENSIYSPVVIIDNITFIDKKSRDFIRYLIDHIDYKPFFLISDRIFDPNISKIFPETEELLLPPLSREESKLLIEKLINIKISKADLNYIIDESKGNPFFIEEFIKYINQQQKFTRVPSSIQTIILAQIDRLSPQQKELLQKASVIGSTFSLDELSYVHYKTSSNKENIENDLSELLKVNIIEKVGKQYRFRQEMIREVIYSTILKENKIILHRLVAFYFMRYKKNESIKIIHHLLLANEYNKAYKIFNQISNYTMDYVPYIDKLLEIIPDHDMHKKTQLLFVKYAILNNNGYIDLVPAVIEKMSEKVFSIIDTKAYAEFYHMLSTFAFERFDYYNTELFGLKGLYYYKISSEEYINESLYHNLLRFTALARFYKKNIDGAKILLAQLPDESVESIYLSSQIVFFSGEYEKGLDILEKQCEKIKRGELTDDFAMTIFLTELIFFYYELGAFSKIYETCNLFVEKVIPTYKQYSRIYSYFGISAYYLGKHEEAFEYLKKAEYNAKQLNNNYYKARVQAFISEAYYMSSNLSKAYEYAFEALRITNLNCDHVTSCEVLLLLVLISLQKNDYSKAKFFLSEVLIYENSSILLEFKYRHLIYYLQYLIDDKLNSSEKKERLINAAEMLKNKLKNIKSDDLKDSFLKMRFNKNILEEYEKLTKAI